MGFGERYGLALNMEKHFLLNPNLIFISSDYTVGEFVNISNSKLDFRQPFNSLPFMGCSDQEMDFSTIDVSETTPGRNTM